MYININDINAALEKDESGYIADCDKAFEAQILEIAEFVKENRQTRPVILLSGPSGSGKTTSAKKLENILDNWNIETHTLSMDNYFLPLTKGEKVDLESPERVDSILLNAQLRAIEEGVPVEVPQFDFTNNTRSCGYTLHRKPGELVILEGIHALNPNVITLPEAETIRIYVSVHMRVVQGETVLHPKKIRLLRRMLRDKLYRGRKAADTLVMFESVQRGENRYIMPYKKRAMFDIDTFIPYEIGAYRNALVSELQQLPEKQVGTLSTVVSAARAVNLDLLAPDSLIREFVGGSIYD